MSATIRLSIAWPPAEPKETTDTLVLSFPSKHFIDLRFVKDASPAKLDWGFAGTTDIVGKTTTFTHLLDSSNLLDPRSVLDSGDFEVLPNGNEREAGSHRDPKTGKQHPYEEIWHKLDQRPEEGYVCLESAGEDAGKVFIGRVGRLFQGIGVVDGRVSAVRLRRDEAGEWQVERRVGDHADLLKVIDLGDSQGWKEGETVEHGGRKWVVHDVNT